MTFEKISDLLAKQLGIAKESITLESEIIKDLGADSLDIVEMLMGLEEEFEIEIPNEAAEKIVTVGDAVEQIKNALNA